MGVDIVTTRRIAAASALALLFHGGGVLYSATIPRQSLPTMSVKELQPFWEIEFEDEHVALPRDTTPGARAPGGGSVDRGEENRSEDLAAKPEVKHKPVSLAAKVAPERLLRPAPATVERSKPDEVLPAEKAEEPDLFALDSVLDSELGNEPVANRTRPEAVRTTISQSLAAAPERSRPTAVGKLVRDSATFGMGRGKGGGRGGNGAGFGDGRGSFGGSSGHFRGQVCFIEPGTKALRQLSLCQVQGEFFTDVFNITPRSFTAGFPGVSERTEWFAILYTGTVTVKHAGSYRFRVIADDGAILRIDGEVVVDNDGQHGPLSVGALKHLDPGEHRLELRYFQGPRTMVALQVFVTPPDEPERLLRGTL